MEQPATEHAAQAEAQAQAQPQAELQSETVHVPPSSSPAQATTTTTTKTATTPPKLVHSLVIDANAIIKNDPTVSTLLAQAEELFTIPAVVSESAQGP
jgi:RNA-binding protein NOB1